jgi:hypothetical protein
MSNKQQNITKVYINTHKYDLYQAKACIASVRYWYPDISIILIKDLGSGIFDTKLIEKIWNVKVFNTEKKVFGWGYGKLEPLFLNEHDIFLMLDADTVMLGPLLDNLCNYQFDFLIDAEVQPEWRFNQIYYNLNRINEIAPEFNYPGYSFNSGQWIGKSGILKRTDFELTLSWTTPPNPKFPDIVFNGDQAHLNFVLHKLGSEKKIQVERQKIMIFPENGNAEFISIEQIKNKINCYPYILHWAGYKKLNNKAMPRYDIFKFFHGVYYSKMSSQEKYIDLFLIKKYKLERFIKYYRRKLIQLH